ncbi:MAG: hypothetical protein Q4C89_01435 [Deinococcus sp.]|uniref:hypothetical protein n=1 Tax=Deinococcus sp. TaxID=47478 RepID=UPI0026DDA1A1|nr:hypothetical protein [Deinococcus sp.]MDO4244671.1 hypothetical protein [Deinococcus sp.]
MTGRASLLRRVRLLEDRASLRASLEEITRRDIVRALELMEDAPLIALEEGMSAGRIPSPFCGPDALALLSLEDPQTEDAAVWARAFLSGEDVGALPEGAALYFGDRAADLEDLTRDTADGEEKTRLQDAAAGWASLEALARALSEKGDL